jgi:hypothetical protein
MLAPGMGDLDADALAAEFMGQLVDETGSQRIEALDAADIKHGAPHLAEADGQLLGQAFQPAAMIERPLAGKRNDGALAIAANL